MWIIQKKKAVSDKQQDSIQLIKNLFRSGRIGASEIVNQKFINISMGFSQ
jgi:hypothetical protein